MTPERWQQVKEIFNAALERDAAERGSFLDRACAGDEGLRQKVEDLLTSDEQTARLIDRPVIGLAAELLAAPRSPSVLGRTLGAYKVVNEVGRGGMGEVYLARDSRLDRLVAIKLLPDSFIHDADRVRRFQQEARAASLLNHPNIVTIHEVAESEGLRFIVSEFVEGKTLRECLNTDGLKLEQALDIMIQTASALGAAHHAGIVHRDIKPENIMLRPDGYVKVLDFGLAKLTEQPSQTAHSESQTGAAAASESSTKTGVVMGTVKYMSPEQARGEKVDHRTDIFSLGVVLYEAITGSAPFDGETASHTIVAILEHEPPPISDYLPNAPTELQRVIDNALRKQREERYQTVSKMLDDLREVREEVVFRARQGRHSGGVSNTKTAVAAQTRSGQRRRRAVMWATILAVAVAGLTFGVYEYIRARRAPSPQPTGRAPSSQSVKMNMITANGKIWGAAITVARDQPTLPAQLWHLSYPTGELRKLTNDFSNYIDLSVTPHTNVIVTVQSERLSNVWVAPGGDAARARQITDSRHNGVGGISWTPDGRVVYCSRVSDNVDIWIMDADGGNRRRLTDNPDGDRYPSVSRDGRYVVFESRTAGRPGIWRMDIDGGNLVQLTSGKGESAPQCSPDGRWVYYHSIERPFALWKVPLDGGAPVLLLEKEGIRPIVSPDQKMIAYLYSDLQMNPPYGVAVAPVEGGQPIKLFAISHEGQAIQWTPDGRALAYLDDRSMNVWAQPLDASKPVQLTNFKTDLIFWFAWSRDGKQLALARGTITSDAVLISNFK